MNVKRTSFAIGAILYGCAIWYCDSFFVLLAFIGIVCVGLAGSFFALALAFAAKRSTEARQLAMRIFKGAAVMVLIAGAALGLNHFAQDYALNAAKAYPERIASLLEEHRKAHGVYPTSLAQIAAKPAVPRLLRGADHFHSDGNTYMFTFVDPGSFFDVWIYESETKRWELSS